MFTINSPENPHLPSMTARTLRSALKIKHARQSVYNGCHFIITDGNGYVVSTKEQSTYLANNWHN